MQFLLNVVSPRDLRMLTGLLKVTQGLIVQVRQQASVSAVHQGALPAPPHQVVQDSDGDQEHCRCQQVEVLIVFKMLV